MSERGRFVIRDGKLVSKDEAAPLIELGPMSDLPCPMVMGDHMAPVQSQVDGRMYDSKSAIRAHYRREGVIEVGNDPARHRRTKPPKPSREQIKATVERARARYERGERV